MTGWFIQNCEKAYTLSNKFMALHGVKSVLLSNFEDEKKPIMSQRLSTCLNTVFKLTTMHEFRPPVQIENVFYGNWTTPIFSPFGNKVSLSRREPFEMWAF